MSNVKAAWDDSSEEESDTQKDTKVKGAWDDDSEEESEAEEEVKAKTEEKQYTALREKKKGLAIGKSEKLEKKRVERKKKFEDDDHGHDGFGAPLTAEEKARRQALVEKADMENAMDMFGVAPAPAPASADSLDSADPTTPEEFDDFSKLLVTKLTGFEGNPYYVKLLEDVLRDVAQGLDEQDIKKLVTVLNVVSNEKKKAARDAMKKGGKKKKQPTMKMERKAMDFNEDDVDFGGEFDDFM